MPDRTDTEALLSDRLYRLWLENTDQGLDLILDELKLQAQAFEASRKEDRERIAKLEGALRKIAHEYESTGEEMEASAKHTGLDYCEYLEMAFDNIQDEARSALTPTK